jgi:hypothetical protein
VLKNEGMFGSCRRKEVPRRRARQEEAADRDACTGVASIQAITHSSSYKLRMHMKRLGDGRLPAIHHAQFTPAVSRQGPWPASDPAWRAVRYCQTGDGRCLATRHWATSVWGDLFACGCDCGASLRACNLASNLASAGDGFLWHKGANFAPTMSTR